MIAKGNNHDPVMLDRVVELLAPSLAVPDAVYVDCTLGLGGHARAVLEAAPSARLIGIDRDPEALAVARERLGSFAERIVLVKAVYDELLEVLADLGVGQVHAVLADLGVSSLQIDREERGFAYRVDAPLDRRMSGGKGEAPLICSIRPPRWNSYAFSAAMERRNTRNESCPRSCGNVRSNLSLPQVDWWMSSLMLFQPLRGVPRDISPSVPFRLSGSRSTMS